MSTIAAPLTIPQTVSHTVTALRSLYPDALVCVRCVLLLATRRESYASSGLSDEARLTYVCSGCSQAAHIAAAATAQKIEVGRRLNARPQYTRGEREAIAAARYPNLARLYPDGHPGPFPWSWAIAGPGFGSSAADRPVCKCERSSCRICTGPAPRRPAALPYVTVALTDSRQTAFQTPLPATYPQTVKSLIPRIVSRLGGRRIYGVSRDGSATTQPGRPRVSEEEQHRKARDRSRAYRDRLRQRTQGMEVSHVG